MSRPPLLFSDFDGTLAPLVDDPGRAELLPAAARALEAWARLGIVCLISGRRLSDLRQRAELPFVTYAGNHGLEIEGPMGQFTHPGALRVRNDLVALAEMLVQCLEQIPGVWVEDKQLSLSVHFRKAPVHQHRAIQSVVLERSESFPSLRVTEGHTVVDIRPCVAWTKGDAARLIMNQVKAAPDSVVILGDDATDEDMFHAIPDALTVHVGSSETTAARITLPSPQEVAPFLWQTIQRLEQEPG